MGTAELEKKNGSKRKQELVIESHFLLTIDIPTNVTFLLVFNTLTNNRTDCMIFDQKPPIDGRSDCY